MEIQDAACGEDTDKRHTLSLTEDDFRSKLKKQSSNLLERFFCETGVTGMWVPPYFGSGGTHMPRQLGPPPGPKCLGIWVRVIICASRHLGPGRGRRGGGGTEFPDEFYLLALPVLIR